MDRGAKIHGAAFVSQNFLTSEARWENAAALSSALGFTLEQAAEALDLEIAITIDPADAEEFLHNQQIEELQGNRNPYIDFADLIDPV